MVLLTTRYFSSGADSNHFVRTRDLTVLEIGEERNHANKAKPLNLTRREGETYALVMAGKANKEIAASLGISSRTVKFHVANIFKKRGVAGRLELLAKVVEKAS